MEVEQSACPKDSQSILMDGLTVIEIWNWPDGQLKERITYAWWEFPIQETPVTGMFSGTTPITEVFIHNQKV